MSTTKTPRKRSARRTPKRAQRFRIPTLDRLRAEREAARASRDEMHDLHDHLPRRLVNMLLAAQVRLVASGEVGLW